MEFSGVSLEPLNGPNQLKLNGSSAYGGLDAQGGTGFEMALMVMKMISASALGLLIASVYVDMKVLQSYFRNGEDGQQHLVVEIVEIIRILKSRLYETWKFLVELVFYALEQPRGEDGVNTKRLLLWFLLTQVIWGITQTLFYWRFTTIFATLESGDPTKFHKELAVQFCLQMLVQIVRGFQDIALNKVQFLFRNLLSTSLVRVYLKQQLFYRRNKGNGAHLALIQDVRKFTGELFKALSQIVFPFIRALVYYQFLRPVNAKVYVFLACYSACLLCGVAYFRWDYDTLQRDVNQADYNLGNSLKSIQQNAEALAFYQGEDVEIRRVEVLAKRAMEASNKSKVEYFKHSMFARFGDIFIQLFPLWLFSGEYFAGKVDIGDLFFVQTMYWNTFFYITSLPDTVMILKGVYNSGSNLKDIVQYEERNLLPVEELQYPEHGEATVVIKDLSVAFATPLHNLSLQVNRGEKVLIEGGNGLGKTTVFRALAGLLDREVAQGSLHTLERERCIFVPQLPYLLEGATLRDQVLFPRWSTSDTGRPTDQEIKNVLQSVQLWDRFCKPSEKEDPSKSEGIGTRIEHVLERIGFGVKEVPGLNPDEFPYGSDVAEFLRDIGLEGIIELYTWYENNNAGQIVENNRAKRRKSDAGSPEEAEGTAKEILDKLIEITELSGGQRQLLGMTRLLLLCRWYAKSEGNEKARVVVFMDEATNALQPEAEKAVYTLLKEECETLITIGHHKALRKYHDYGFTVADGTAFRSEF